MLRSTAPSSTMSDVDQKFWDYFNLDVTPSEALNVTDDLTAPASEQGFVIGMYSALLTTGAFGNVAVFTSLVRSRRRKSRVNLLMTHLAVADMIVTFFVIPLEIGWRTTNAWLAGNAACKFFLVLRAFGLYLSSNILVCISLDRFFAVLYPLRLPIARKRSKTMLSFAWLVALLCSLPQSLVFRVLSHPKVPDFQQCVSFEAFPNQHHELAYNVFCLCAMYFVPLLVISVCYACIFYEISKNSKEITDKCQQSNHSRIQLRRSDRRPLARARRRTLRMTVTIVTVFACCWLPYATMTLWYMVDRQSAEHVSARVQDLFFIMAVSNSCMDPLVYGSYTLDFRTLLRTMRKIFHSKTPDLPGISGPDTLKTKLATNDVAHADTVLDPLNTNLNSYQIKTAKNCVKLHPKFVIRAQCTRHYAVRFEETSLVRPSCSSDPIQNWSEHSIEDRTMKPSRSCEVFTLYTPQRNFYINSSN